MYAKVLDNNIIQYPADPLADHKNTSFPVNWGGGVIGDSEYVVVNPTGCPSLNIGWKAVEDTPINIDGVWQQNWISLIKPRGDIKSDVSSKRYLVEVGGVRINNNLYATDRESQTKYVAVAVDIQQANTETWSITWKTLDNQFISLNASEMSNVISGVRQHVQACFNKEAEYYLLIDTADQATLEATDFSAGWPSNN